MTASRPTSFWLVAPFLLGSVAVAVVVFVGVPLTAARGMEPLVAWMLLAPPLVFLPLAALGGWLLRTEDRANLVARLWLGRPRPRDWFVGCAGVLAIVALTAPLAWLAARAGLAIHPVTITPPRALTSDTLWMIGVWLVYWPINILGEEFVWRSVLLPRMVARFGSRAWLVNAALWFVFHLSFGPGNLIVLIPTLAIVPWVVQRRQNAWLGVLLHATPSLPGFVAMALGAV
jgi:membrane protease YdiL (CAAX protease family)